MAIYAKAKPVLMDKENIRRNYNIDKSVEDFLDVIESFENRDKNRQKRCGDSYNRKKSDLKKFIEFRNIYYKKVVFTYNISQEMIHDYLFYLQNLKKVKGRKNETLSANTIIAYFHSLNAYVRFLAENNAIRENVYRYVYNNNFVDSQKKNISLEQGFLTREQILEIYKNTEMYKTKGNYYRNRAIIGLLLHGFRRGEIINLKWKDINLDTGIATVTLYKVRKKIAVRLADFALDDLKKYFDSLNLDKKNKTNFIFETCHGNPIGKNKVRDIVSCLTEDMTDSEGKNITTRTFRKTFVNLNIMLNYPINFIQLYTNHTTAVLQKYYQKIRPNVQIDNTDYINSYFNYINTGKREMQKIELEDVLQNEELMGKLTNIILGRMVTTVNNFAGAAGVDLLKDSIWLLSFPAFISKKTYIV